MSKVSQVELKKYLNSYLNIYEFSDYGPNGLQIEGKSEIKKVAFAVSATADSISKAVAMKADALIVHHGLFWKFHGVRTITKTFAARVKPLIQNDINLFGYHLPLDAHPEVGNAANLARELGLKVTGPFGDHKGSPTGVKAVLPKAMSGLDFQKHIQEVLKRDALYSHPENTDEVSSVGIITGGANGDWIHSEREGLDAYITGEMSEHDWHESRESGIHMYACGHHATERYGVLALKDHLKEKYGLEVEYIESNNPA